MRQVVQRRHYTPAVHLTLVDLLGTVIQAGGIAQANGVGGCKHAKRTVRTDHLVLIKQGQSTLDFEYPLNNKHHIRAARIVFIKHQSAGTLQRPRQNTFLKLGDLFAVLQHNRIFANQVNSRDVAVQINPNTGPVKARCNLLNMC